MQRRAFALVDRMVHEYRAKTPSYSRVVSMLREMGHTEIQSDHIALRTFRCTDGFQTVRSKLVEDGAYVARDCFQFPEKHIVAQWFSPSDARYPRVFLSELRDERLSPWAQAVLAKYLPRTPVKYDDYVTLERESNYAAWTLLHGTVVNHETIPVHTFGTTLDDFVTTMKARGLTFVETPAIVKVSPDGLLCQASSPADLVDFHFADREAKVPGSFVEYIHRAVLPQYTDVKRPNDAHRRDGFAEGNAFHIFDSTKVALAETEIKTSSGKF